MTGIGWESAFTSLSTMSSKVVAGFAHAKGTRCAIIIIIINHGSLRFAEEHEAHPHLLRQFALMNYEGTSPHLLHWWEEACGCRAMSPGPPTLLSYWAEKVPVRFICMCVKLQMMPLGGVKG